MTSLTIRHHDVARFSNALACWNVPEGGGDEVFACDVYVCVCPHVNAPQISTALRTPSLLVNFNYFFLSSEARALVQLPEVFIFLVTQVFFFLFFLKKCKLEVM